MLSQQKTHLADRKKTVKDVPEGWCSLEATLFNLVGFLPFCLFCHSLVDKIDTHLRTELNCPVSCVRRQSIYEFLKV